MGKENISIEDIMASLDKETSQQLKLASSVSHETIPTPSYRINAATGGGLRKGKQHTLWGPEGTAKSAFAMGIAAIAQQNGQSVAWLDAEHIFDPSWARTLGLDPDRLAYSQVSTVAEVSNLQVKLIKMGIDLIIIDSTSALMPRSYIDKHGEIKDFGDTGQMGAVAKDLGQMCKMVQGMNWNTAILHISQARVDVGSAAMNKPYMPVGGKEVRHTDALRIRFTASKSDDKQLKKKVQRGSMLVEENVGYPINWIINKNRLTGEEPVGVLDFYKKNNPDFCGFDRAAEVLDASVDYGLVDKGGAWYKFEGQNYQGRPAILAHLYENPEIVDKLEAALDEQSV